MNITADTGLCINCKAINFDDVFSADYMLGIPINGYRIVCPLRHIDDTRNGSCSLCELLRSLRPTDHRSSDRFFLRARWAKFHIRYDEDLEKIERDTQTALRIVPHDTLLLDMCSTTYIKGKHQQDDYIMELGTEESINKIAARRVDDRVNFELIRTWLRFCREHHQSHCHAVLDGIRDIPGFRVIDCTSRKIIPWVEIPEDHDRSYTALSYLWGTDTSTATQDGRIPSPSPKVIEDAVTATIELGFNYLWVDRYCIPQHESALKGAQMKRMDDVYGSSAVTIVASAGDGPAYGLPGVSSTPRVPQKSVRVGSRTLITINNDISYTIRKSKWNTRAWTLQEGLLSNRRLCFQDDQVYFQCNLMHRLESISIPLGEPRTANSATDIQTAYLNGSGGSRYLFPKKGISTGSDVVHALDQYVTRQINYPSDGLQAFEGILRKAAGMKDPIYNVWGVLIRVYKKVDMTASLIIGLCWRLGLAAFRGTGFTNTWEISYPGQLRRRLFPSWSWVDWVGNFTEKCISFLQPWEIWMTFFHKVNTQPNTQPLTQSIAMEYADGTILSWESSHQDILLSSQSKEAPRILRIHGYTCDALLWRLPKADCPDTKRLPSSKITSSFLRELSDFWFDDGWIWSDRDRRYCHLLLMWPAGIKFRQSDLSNPDLCLFADWLETDKGPSSPSPLREEYSFRVILLRRGEGDLEFMVLTPVDRGKGYPDSYERVNVIARPLLPGLSPETRLENLDPEFLRGWTVQETIIV